MQKKVLPVAVVVLAVAGLVFAAGLDPQQDNFPLGWISSISVWQGSTDDVEVQYTLLGVYYLLKASPANLTGGPLSEVRMSVDGGAWTDGFDDYASFVGNGSTITTLMTAKCTDSGPPGEAEGWAKIELFVDTDKDGILDEGESTPVSAMHIHGTSD
jgi:hypothetical protein